MNPRPRILLADDHTLLLEAFKGLLSPHCEVVSVVSDGRALLEVAPKLKPDVVVLDISMPRLNGIDACRLLQPKLPDTKWVFLTVNEDPDLTLEAMRLGASAFLLKSSAASELFTAIQKALKDERYITPLITKAMSMDEFLSQPNRLHSGKMTDRQREVLQLLAEGRTMKEAADILHVTERTVEFHKYAVMKQLDVKTTAELVQYAVKHGIVKP